MSLLVRVHIFVSGRVQGVFFRDSCQRKAKKLRVTGWVKNLPDGRVEILVEGEKEKVESMLNWARKGPIFAKVEGVQVHFEEYQGEFRDFEITYAP